MDPKDPSNMSAEEHAYWEGVAEERQLIFNWLNNRPQNANLTPAYLAGCIDRGEHRRKVGT